MSYSQNGSNGYYINGGLGVAASNGYNGNQQGPGPVDSSGTRRVGGYGGFMGDNLHLPVEDEERIPFRQRGYEAVPNGNYLRRSPERGRASHEERRRSREQEASRLSVARTYGSGPGERQIEGQTCPVIATIFNAFPRPYDRPRCTTSQCLIG